MARLVAAAVAVALAATPSAAAPGTAEAPAATATAAAPPLPDAGTAATVAAAAAAAKPGGGAGFWSRLLAGGPSRGDVRAAWAAAAKSAAEARGPVARSAAESKPSNGPVLGYDTFLDAGLAGDLNGDRRPDVVRLDQTFRRYEQLHVSDHFDLAAYDGETGRRLWTSRVAPPEVTCAHADCGYSMRLGFAFPVRVGSGNGIEIVVFSDISDSPDSAVAGLPPYQRGAIFAIDVVHVDGRGRQRWARHLEGRFDYHGPVMTLQRLPIPQGYGWIESGGLDDWLFTVLDGRIVDNAGWRRSFRAAPYVPNVPVLESRAVVLDARHGRLRDIGKPVSGQAAVRDLDIVGDLSGDGRDDLVQVHPPYPDGFGPHHASAGDGAVTAIRSSDGSALWQRTLASGPVVWTTTTGDRGRDVVAAVARPGDDAVASVARLDGATGAVRWEKPAADALPLPDAAAADRVLLTTLDAARVVGAAAYDTAGRRRWSRRLTLPARLAGELVGASTSPAGDLDGDRVGDAVVYALAARPGDVLGLRVGIVGMISGRSGRPLPFRPDAFPLRGSVDGRGDDTSTPEKTGVTVRAGDTGRALWTVGFGRPAYARAETDGTHGRCGSLLAVAYLPAPGGNLSLVVGRFSASGTLLWTRRFGPRTGAHPRTLGRAYRC